MERDQMQWLGNGFDGVQQWLFETVLQPLMFAMGLASLLENGYEAAGWLLVGLLQLLVSVALIGPRQRFWPVEPLRAGPSVRPNILYPLTPGLGRSAWP